MFVDERVIVCLSACLLVCLFALMSSCVYPFVRFVASVCVSVGMFGRAVACLFACVCCLLVCLFVSVCDCF